ncbi:Trk system potassium transporter TrkA [Cuneatibacter caecimuris]|uniref:Trk system potassium uptake protein TrkA n=1 Tax=Cuneatibacter caecimuris TaxID=1796618 RepID=A0A4Q7PQA2_9FIRM|nr:Trk system potassium transporter TrkA [Cuneatibacter caecimuris]RZT03093.1 trk system potassium uptake protein TrkA [Cuneatibacter caecimuris]
MNIIIVGCGKVGRSVTEQLSKEEHDITVVDIRSDRVEMTVNTVDVMGIVGNGASYEVLTEAGVKKAHLLIAVTGSDELNLLCCLVARKAGGCHTIARVRNPEYSRQVALIKEDLGLSMTINPEYAAAMEISRILRFPSAMKIETFAKGRVEILQFRIQKNSLLANYAISEISTKLGLDILVCAVERGGEVFIPNGNFVLEVQDLVHFIAPPKKAGEFFQKIGVDTHQVKDAMIVGGGKIAYYLAKQLLNMRIKVTIVEMSKERCEQLSDMLPQAMIIQGDATDETTLMEEGLPYTESFVALTNLDEENILLSLFAASKSRAKLVTKINRVNFNEIIDNMDLGSVIYPKKITTDYILQYVRAMQNSIGSNVETLYQLADGNVEALEFYIREDSPVVNIPLETLKLRENLLIGCINRKGKVITPRGQDMIQVGDTVIVVTTNQGLRDIKDILQS